MTSRRRPTCAGFPFPSDRGVLVKVNDALSGVLFVGLAGLIFFLTRSITLMPGQDYGGDFFPRSIAVIMALLGCSLIYTGIRDREGQAWATPLEWMRSPKHASNFALVVAALIFYIWVSDDLGFAITAFITLFALLVWLRGLAFWFSSAVISLLSMLAIQQFFGQLLRVPLPWGVLQAYSW